MRRTLGHSLAGAAFAAGLLDVPAAAVEIGERALPEHIVTLHPRGDVTLRYLLIEPEKPVATLVLLTGGNGFIHLPEEGTPYNSWQGNFLVRSRQLFAAHKFTVAVVDAPSDRQGQYGLDASRMAEVNANDLAAVMAGLRQHSKGPVWLVGTSRGTLSAVNAATRLSVPAAADGLVLTSSITRGQGGGNPSEAQRQTVYGPDLNKVGVPVLVVAHKDDACRQSPASEAAPLQAKFTGSRRTGLIVIEGGDTPRSDPCEALAPHGYLGREAVTVDAISAWVAQTD